MVTALLVTTLNVIGYMALPWGGFVTTSLTLLWILSRIARPLSERVLVATILTIPFYAVPIVPSLHFVFSWTTGFLIVLIALCAKRVRVFSPSTFFTLMLIAALTIFTNLYGAGLGEGSYYVFQVLLMVVPLTFVYAARNEIAADLDVAGCRRIFDTLAGTVSAMGLGVIIQWAFYTYAGLSIGEVVHFRNRVSFDLTINGFSVLSGLLAVGLVLALILYREGRWAPSILALLLSSAGIILNTARTGLAAGLVTLLVAVLFPGRGSRAGRVRLLLAPGIVFSAWLVQEFAQSSRGQSMGDILDDNGRWELIGPALEAFFSDPSALLFGIGYFDTEGMVPHNFATETLIRSGVVASIALLIFGVIMLRHLWGTQWQYPVWALLIGSMLFTGMYAVKAAPVMAAVMIILRSAEQLSSSEGVSSSSLSRLSQIRN